MKYCKQTDEQPRQVDFQILDINKKYSIQEKIALNFMTILNLINIMKYICKQTDKQIRQVDFQTQHSRC